MFFVVAVHCEVVHSYMLCAYNRTVDYNECTKYAVVDTLDSHKEQALVVVDTQSVLLLLLIVTGAEMAGIEEVEAALTLFF